ncbi:MAG: N-acetylmuramoyl-L-alanine amidase [Planctomycetota bacterium]|nr:N-acetylmuramoyl-L-alanine amidase [Planctomycetota bacterium]
MRPLLVLLPLIACVSAAPAPEAIGGHAIVVCGERFAIDAPVVLWDDPGGYSAYLEGPHFTTVADPGRRYSPGRTVPDDHPALSPEVAERLRSGSASPAELAAFVDLFVLHYDVCGTSELCFRVLQDERHLSVHFLLDLDGTLYQTLDLADQAWHAAHGNPRSVGVELASIGAWAPGDERGEAYFSEWYLEGNFGTAVTLPERYGDGGQRSGRRVFPAASEGRKRGAVHGQVLEQYDFTQAQVDSLAALTVALHRALPGIALDVPRDGLGQPRWDALSAEEFAAWGGLLGHYHLGTHKVDPGPAMDWERLLRAARDK